MGGGAEIVPLEWKYRIMLPVHKKEDALMCDNYRAVVLLRTEYKTLGKYFVCKITTLC